MYSFFLFLAMPELPKHRASFQTEQVDAMNKEVNGCFRLVGAMICVMMMTMGFIKQSHFSSLGIIICFLHRLEQVKNTVCFVSY
jgi:hypothetical protein